MKNDELFLIKNVLDNCILITYEDQLKYKEVCEILNKNIIKNNLNERARQLSKICPRCNKSLPEKTLFTRQGICCLKC